MQVFVVYYDEIYPGFGERGRRIEGVFATADAARERVRALERMAHILYVDFDVFEVV